ncbi:sugar phosphate isomerase/epimerase [Kribbella rubisoli]|uniref:Sugar phosphate isomerase/epimerase n=1 Tax=Kribbella rubisoli TaxID=3075929 RepID=A0A4Q7WMX9_9ACTN|nr:sugar phosphate isomerase/epimerase [Kribbella rubisoli]RZU11380.1 sugar phosphate isomerase/epimerase [Kribbella rubisoli]
MPTTNPLGAQLYTLRDYPADRTARFAALAAAGYGAVEQPRDDSVPAEQLRAELDAAGLTVSSIHAKPAEGFAEAVATARALGTDTVIQSIGNRDVWTDVDAVRGYARELGELSRRLADEGIRFGYHNHQFELAELEGRTALEIFADELPAGMILEIDTYWAAVGGQDVPTLLDRLGDRVRLLHLKDGPARDSVAPMTALGAGTLPVADIIAACPSAEWHIVELDACATDVLSALVDSADWLFDNGLADRNVTA